MKILTNILLAVGLILLVIGLVIGLQQKQALFFGATAKAVITLANSALLLAILAKLSEKK